MAERELKNSTDRKNLCIARYNPEVLPRIVIVGEGPGSHEMKHGSPFTGPSGKLLDLLLEKNGLEDICFLTNLQFWLMPKTKEEITACRELCKPWLRALLRILEPEFVVGLGTSAARELSGKNNLNLERMRTHDYRLDPG